MTASPETVVQRQLDAYNARDLDAFVACFAEDVTVWRLPDTVPALQGRAALATFYASERFNRIDLHAELLNRMVLGDKVVDHERIRGIGPGPYEAVAVYRVADGLIRAVWFHPAD